MPSAAPLRPPSPKFRELGDNRIDPTLGPARVGPVDELQLDGEVIAEETYKDKTGLWGLLFKGKSGTWRTADQVVLEGGDPERLGGGARGCGARRAAAHTRLDGARDRHRGSAREARHETLADAARGCAT